LVLFITIFPCHSMTYVLLLWVLFFDLFFCPFFLFFAVLLYLASQKTIARGIFSGAMKG